MRCLFLFGDRKNQTNQHHKTKILILFINLKSHAQNTRAVEEWNNYWERYKRVVVRSCLTTTSSRQRPHKNAIRRSKIRITYNINFCCDMRTTLWMSFAFAHKNRIFCRSRRALSDRTLINLLKATRHRCGWRLFPTNNATISSLISPLHSAQPSLIPLMKTMKK